VYPEEKEGRIKDANRKLRSDLKRERNKVKQLQQDLASLQRAFNKSCQYISEKLADQNIENVIELVNDFDYKETQKGREREEVTKQNKDTIFISKNCPDCGNVKGENYQVLNFASFRILTCKCGFRKRISQGEGNEGS
jgi:hypothetical protein